MALFKIKQVNEKESGSFYRQIEFELKFNLGTWDLAKVVSESELISIRDQINETLGLSEMSQKFSITISDSEKIKKFQKAESKRCNNCVHLMIECSNCVLTCQSPLERDLYLALRTIGLNVSLQQRVNKDGSIDDKNIPVIKETILTIPDFYISIQNEKYAIYTDGHTYHERNEYQATRDRSIDRELQLLNFTVLRYTGKEVRSKLFEITSQIYSLIYKSGMNSDLQIKLNDFINKI